MKYEVIGVVDGKPCIIFASNNKEEYKNFVHSLPNEPDDEPEEYNEQRNYSPSQPWNAPGMRISDFF